MEGFSNTGHLFENILQGITDSVLLLSKDFTILWANEAFQNQTGYKREEIIGNHCYRLTYHQEVPCQLSHDLCPIVEALKNGRAATTTHTHFDKEGNKIFVEVSAYPMKDERGEILQFVYIYRDITEIKRAEDLLRHALEESQQRQAEIAALLEGSSAVLKYPDFEGAAKAIYDSCKKLIGATSGYIAMVSEDGTKNEVLFLDSWGITCTVDPTLPMPIRGLRGESYHNVKTVYNNDFARSEWVKFLPEGHTELKNVLFAPLVLEGKTVGLLGLANKAGGFTDNDARIALAFAELAAIALVQKQVEGALRTSSHEWYETFDAVEDPLFLMNTKGEVLRCNQAFARHIQKPFTEIIHLPYKELIPSGAEYIEKCFLSMQKTHNRETTIFQTKDKWFNITLDPTLDEDNKLIGGVCILSDITDKILAERELQESLSKYRSLFSNMMEGFAYHEVLFDDQGRAIDYVFLEVNDAFEKLTGLKREDVIGRRVTEVIPGIENDLADWIGIYGRIALTGEQLRFENYSEFLRRWYSISAFSPQKGYFAAVFEDITERKKAEVALSESQADLNRAQIVANTGSWRLDVRRNELLWSDENHRIFGIPKGTPMTYETFLGIVHPDDREYVDQKWTAALRGEHYDIEHRIVVGDTVKWVRERAELEFDKEGSLRGGFGTTQDITVRKRMEGALREARDELELRVLERTAELAKINEELQTEIAERKRAEEAVKAERQRLNDVLEILPAYVVLLTQDYHVSFANRFFRERFGESHGQRCFEYLFGRSEPCEICETYKVLKTKAPHEWEWTGPDGRNYQIFDFPFTDIDGSNLIMEMGIDVTERKRAEKALEESHELLESAFSNIHVMVAHLDKNFDFIRVNKTYAEADERNPEFFVGKNHFDLYPNEENEAIFKKVVETGEPVFFFEKPFEYAEHPERGVTYWDWSLQPIKNVNGEVGSLVFTLIDRTQSYQSRESLIKSESRFRMLIEQASDGIAILDQQLNFLEVNSMACQISGFTEEELINLNARTLIPHEDFADIALRLNEVLTGNTVLAEMRLIRKDRTVITVEVSAKMLEDGNIQTIVRDVTERKEAENKDHVINTLMELFATKSSRKEYLGSVAQVIHEWSGCRCVGIRVINDQGYIPYECTIGFSLDFLRLENMLSLKKDICACIRAITGEFEPQDTDVITPARSFYLNNSSNFLNGLTEKEKARFRGNCIRNGFMSIAIIPIRYREQVRGAIHMTDEREGMVPLKKLQFIESIAPLIGEAMHRFKIEETLRRNESYLSEAQRIARLGNWVWDVQNNELFWSDEVYRIFGLTPQQFGATYDEFLNYVHPKDRELVKKAVNEALYGRPYNIEYRIILPDGAVRIVHEKGEVTFGESGEPVQMLGTVQNITDRKKVEEELKKSSEQLRNLSAHLQSVKEEERTNIAREIHDELGQVLTSLKIDVSMLASKLSSDDNEPLLEKTESMIKRIDETIQTVKRICTELRPTILDHFGLSAAIEWQSGEFESRTGIKCGVSFEPREIILDQDLTTAVFRIFQEALTNVARHARATEVNVSLRLKDGKVMLEVKDNGKGITEKEFSNPQSFGIIGIKERAIFFGGDVKINGIRDKGTTLTVCIPLRKKEELHDKNIDSR
jgi:PAS domain S-box-containing protein